MDQLPLPQSYPPNTAPEIDPATLCFESPISLSSNDTSLNGSHPAEQIAHHPELQITNNNAKVSSSYPQECPTNIQQSEPSVQSPHVNSLQQCNTNVDNNNDATEQQHRLGDFLDTIPHINSEPQLQKQTPAEYATHASNSQTAQCCTNIEQHASPQSINIQHASPQTVNMQHPSPQNLNQQHHSPMFPPQQSPQVVIPNSPHLAPQSPQISQKSPLLHPMSPHIPPQSPHYNNSATMPSPGVQQTPYNYRNRTGSMSKVTPPDLTPPPGTPSPSKPSPDRYQQYLQQSRVPLKSPNVTISGREMQYPPTAGNMGSNNVQPNLNNVMSYQQHQHASMGNQHFFPTNQYMDPRYISYHQHIQQMAQAAQPSGMYGQLPANPAAGMYGYYT